ncbi:unnamed protein product [Pleuronectes platessa]|uniref:Uncharacterized protein n=1 Tax=Pleuronectes platessa TaxID=8262 RepID=A0A9N7YJL0_PLEPL|nr:unnamed protein product [Pleuronectes platessa]
MSGILTQDSISLTEAPGRCAFQSPSNFFLKILEQSDGEGANTQTHSDTTKGSTPLFLCGKPIPRRYTAGSRHPDVLKVDGPLQHYVNVTGHGLERRSKLSCLANVRENSGVLLPHSGLGRHYNTVLRRRKRRKRRRCGLTISTDVRTTSETLCLSPAAVPGLPRPRVNFLVSGLLVQRQTDTQEVFDLMGASSPRSAPYRRRGRPTGVRVCGWVPAC